MQRCSVTGDFCYLEQSFYSNWTQIQPDVSDSANFAAQLRAAGITHVVTNDYVINVRSLHDAWLARPEFQVACLRELVCAEGRCFYALK